MHSARPVGSQGVPDKASLTNRGIGSVGYAPDSHFGQPYEIPVPEPRRDTQTLVVREVLGFCQLQRPASWTMFWHDLLK